jgi:CRP-like cAMP-binding protein
VIVQRKVVREHEMLSFTAAERLRRFVAAHTALDARVTRELVASYLGITPVHLSRLRAARRRSAR